MRAGPGDMGYHIRGSCGRRELVKNFGIFQTCKFPVYVAFGIHADHSTWDN